MLMVLRWALKPRYIWLILAVSLGLLFSLGSFASIPTHAQDPFTNPFDEDLAGKWIDPDNIDVAGSSVLPSRLSSEFQGGAFRFTGLARYVYDRDDEVSLAGFYGKSGNEIRAMRDFVKRALEAKAALRINTVVPRGEYL